MRSFIRVTCDRCGYTTEVEWLDEDLSDVLAKQRAHVCIPPRPALEAIAAVERAGNDDQYVGAQDVTEFLRRDEAVLDQIYEAYMLADGAALSDDSSAGEDLMDALYGLLTKADFKVPNPRNYSDVDGLRAAWNESRGHRD